MTTWFYQYRPLLDINVYKEKSIQICVQLLVQYIAAGQTSKILSSHPSSYVYFTLICNKQKIYIFLSSLLTITYLLFELKPTIIIENHD